MVAKLKQTLQSKDLNPKDCGGATTTIWVGVLIHPLITKETYTDEQLFNRC